MRYLDNYGIDASYALSENWYIGARARYIDSGYEYSGLWLPFNYLADTGEVMRVAASQSNATEERSFQLSASGDVDIFGLRNRIVFGYDFRDTTVGMGGAFDPTLANYLDWDNPVYIPAPDVTDLPQFPYIPEDGQRKGLYLQNHLNVSEELILSIGARRDSLERELGEQTQDLDNTSMQLGASYALNDTLNVFASYSESFLANSDRDKNNRFLEPEQGEGFELGIKGNIFTDSVSFTAALFDIEKTNVAQSDPTVTPDDANPFGSRAIGLQRSQGLEIDVQWTVNDTFDVFANWGVAHTEASDVDASGNIVDLGKIANAPLNTASLWTSYDVQTVANVLISVGGGIQYSGRRFVNEAITLDAFTLVSLYARANYKDWEFQVNVANTTDKQYVASTWGSAGRGNHAGVPRQVVASVSYRF